MTPQELQQIQDTISKQIDMSLGTSGLKELQTEFAEHVKNFSRHVESDNVHDQFTNNKLAELALWKTQDIKQQADIAPTLKILKETSSWVRVTVYLIVILGGIATIFGVLFDSFKKR